MTEDKEENTEREKAPFNMAIDTLRRLGKILQDVTIISTNPNLFPNERQEIKINYVKQFYVQASPLLRKEVIEEYKKKVDVLRPKQVADQRRRTGNTPIFLGWKIEFDYKLEELLDQILVELQISLADDGYFMPPSDEDMF